MDDTWEENLTAKFKTRILSLKIFGVKGQQGGYGTKSKKKHKEFAFAVTMEEDLLTVAM